ncbi:hypothetical protein NQU17_03915 [Clostridiaceae bacterium HFYG-1003]|nr:hypothetical protein NQU17_03915 [Clostridiaceae bacterium HFYG-1003]
MDEKERQKRISWHRIGAEQAALPPGNETKYQIPSAASVRQIGKTGKYLV